MNNRCIVLTLQRQHPTERGLSCGVVRRQAHGFLQLGASLRKISVPQGRLPFLQGRLLGRRAGGRVRLRVGFSAQECESENDRLTQLEQRSKHHEKLNFHPIISNASSLPVW